MSLFKLLFGNAFSTPFAAALRDLSNTYHGTRTEIVSYTKRYTRKGVRIIPLEVRTLPGRSRGKARR